MILAIHLFSQTCTLLSDIVVKSISYSYICPNVNQLTSNTFEMLNWFWMFSSWHDHLNVFGEDLRKPECNVSLFSSLLICESINSLNNNHNFLINFLRTENNLLLFYFWRGKIKPICEKLPNIFLEKIDSLFQFQVFL